MQNKFSEREGKGKWIAGPKTGREVLERNGALIPTSPPFWYMGCSLPLLDFTVHTDKFIRLLSLPQSCLFTDFLAHPRNAVCMGKSLRGHVKMYTDFPLIQTF